jgi:hypothetical protein
MVIHQTRRGILPRFFELAMVKGCGDPMKLYPSFRIFRIFSGLQPAKNDAIVCVEKDMKRKRVINRWILLVLAVILISATPVLSRANPLLRTDLDEEEGKPLHFPRQQGMALKLERSYPAGDTAGVPAAVPGTMDDAWLGLCGAPVCSNLPGWTSVPQEGIIPLYLPLVSSSPPEGWITIMAEDFEGDFPAAWDVREYPDNPEADYLWGKRDCQVYQGSYSGWGVGGGDDGSALGCGSNYPDGARSWMVYGPFNLEGMTEADFSFAYWVNSEDAYETDFFYVGASIDGSYFYGQDFYGSSGSWQTYLFDLTDVYLLGDLTGEEEVWVAFLFWSNDSVNMESGAFLDNIVLRKCASGCGGGDFSANLRE